MAGGPGGVNSGAAAAAAAAAARRAEEARKAAERAREAERRAEAARKQAQKQHKPENQIKKLEKKEQQLEKKVLRTADKAEQRIRDANAAARAEGKKDPYSQKEINRTNVKAAEVRDALDGATKADRRALTTQLGVKDTTDVDAITSELKGQRQFENLRADPATAQTLEELDIRSAEDLRGFGDRIAKEANGEARGLEPLDLSDVSDKDALSKIIQGAGRSLTGNSAQLVSSAKFADAVAGGEDLATAATSRKDLNADERAAQRGGARDGLDALGVGQEKFQNLSKKDQEKYLDAARAQADGDPQQAIQTLSSTGPGAEGAINKAAQTLHPKDSAQAKILQNPDAVKELLNSKDGRRSIESFADGKLVEGLRHLGPRAPKGVADALTSDPKIKEGLDKLGINPAELSRSGKALPDIVAATQARRPGEAIDALTDAAKANPQLQDQLAEAITKKAQDLPPGAERNILTDPKTVKAAIDDVDGRRALERVARGDVSSISQIGDPKIRERAIDQAAKDPKFKATLDKAGITPDELKKLGPGQNEVLRALDGLSEQNPDDVKATNRNLLLLSRAAEQDPKARELAEKAIPKVAKDLPNLPNGEPSFRERVLTDPKKVKALLGDKNGVEALQQLASGRGTAAFSELGKNDEKLRDMLLQDAWKDPRFKAGADKLGLSRADLDKADAGAGDLLRASNTARLGKKEDTLKHLGRAYDDAPGVATGALKKYASENLSDTGAEGRLKTVLQNEQLTGSILKDKALAPAWADLVAQKPGQALEKLGKNDAVRDGVIDELATKNPEFKQGLENAGLSARDLEAYNGKAIDKLYNGVDRASTIDPNDEAGAGFKEAMAQFKAAAKEDPKAVNVAVKAGVGSAKTALAGGDEQQGALRDLMTDPGFMKQLLINEKLAPAFDKLTSNDLIGGLKGTTESKEAATAAIDALATNPTVREGLEQLGIKPNDLKDPARLKTFPDFIAASIDAGSGKPLAALDDLARAYQGLEGKNKDFALSALKSLGGSLEDTGLEGIAKSLLTNPTIGKTLLGPGGVASQIAQGDFPGAAAKLLADPTVQKVAARAILSNEKIKSALEPFGLDSPEALIGLKDGVKGAIGLVDALSADDIDPAKVLQSAGELLQGVPDEVKNTIMDKVVDGIGGKLGIPEKYREVLKAGAAVLTDATAVKALGDAFTRHLDDPIKFAQSLAQAGESLAGNPALAETLLNAMAKLPGKVGNLFKDKELNASIAETGTVSNIFGAVEELAKGNIAGAIGELGGAVKELISAGDPLKFKIPPFGPTLGVPGVGTDGLKALSGVFERFYDALPDSVQSKIKTKAMSFVKGFANPISGIKDGITDGKQLIDALKAGDGLEVAINAGQLVTDVAGFVPPLKAAAKPLQFALGVAETVKNANDLVGDVGQFQQEFLG